MPADSLNRSFEGVEHVVAASTSGFAYADDRLDTPDRCQLLRRPDPDTAELLLEGPADVGKVLERTVLPSAYPRELPMRSSTEPTAAAPEAGHSLND